LLSARAAIGTRRKFNAAIVTPRGVVVRERGGTPFGKILWSRNGAPANIVGHRWNASTEAFRQITSYSLGRPSISFFQAKIAPKRGIWHHKSQKKIGATPSCTHPQHGYTTCGGASSPVAGTNSSLKPFPQIKIYHYIPGYSTRPAAVVTDPVNARVFSQPLLRQQQQQQQQQ